MVRDVDVTGISGTGSIAQGVVFADGTTVIHWQVGKPSTAVWVRLQDAIDVHGHEGLTRFVWLDGEVSPS
jgi:hypothetical protein